MDMESAWLAPGAGERPFAVVRVITDTPARELTNPLLTVAGGARAMAALRRAAGALHESDAGGAKVKTMAARMRQSTRMGWYLMRQRLAKREKFPLIVELEPLFQCNLACSGCGKIQHPEHELRRRMPVAQAIGAVEECGAPMVSIAGGEPLIHPEIHVIAAELIKRKRFVYLCTNALLLEKKLQNFKPSPYFSWAVHMDGLRERHDASVEREGVFDKAVAAIKAAKAAGFRVTTNTTFFTQDSPKTVREVLDFLNDDLEVDEMMISPAYAYEKAPDQEHFLGVTEIRKLSRRRSAKGDASGGV